MTLEMFLSIGAFVAVLVGGAWVLVSVIVRQFEKRLQEKFAAQEQVRNLAAEQWQKNFDQLISERAEEEKEWRRVERELNALRVELPREYVRREDHIRFETVINAKLDSVAAKLDLANERTKQIGAAR